MRGNRGVFYTLRFQRFPHLFDIELLSVICNIIFQRYPAMSSLNARTSVFTVAQIRENGQNQAVICDFFLNARYLLYFDTPVL